MDQTKLMSGYGEQYLGYTDSKDTMFLTNKASMMAVELRTQETQFTEG